MPPRQEGRIRKELRETFGVMDTVLILVEVL